MGSLETLRGSPSGRTVWNQVQQPPPQQAPPDVAGCGEAGLEEAAADPARVTATAVNTLPVSV